MFLVAFAMEKESEFRFSWDNWCKQPVQMAVYRRSAKNWGCIYISHFCHV